MAMKVFLVPPPELPVPAVKGGAVETLLEHLIFENEKQGKLELYCASIPDPEAQAKTAHLRHTKMIWLPAESTARACWQQYLYLCGQAAQCPSEALAGRIAALQPALAGVPKAGLSLAERLSAEKWQRLAPRKLLKL